MHLAAAVGTPCACVFSAHNKPGVWFPSGDNHRVVYHKTECFNCRLVTCVENAKHCITSVTVEEMMEAALSALGAGRRSSPADADSCESWHERSGLVSDSALGAL